MALTKGPKRLQELGFRFNDAGDLVGAQANVAFPILDDDGVTPVSEVRAQVDLLPLLTAAQQTSLNTLAKRLRTLAEA